MGPRLHPVRASDRGNPMIHRPYLQSVMGSEITCRHMPFLTCHTCHQFSPPGTPGLASGRLRNSFCNKREPRGLLGSDRV